MGGDDTYAGWTEVAADCFVRRYPYRNVSCTVVVGGEAALVVDTRASLVQGQELAEHVRALTAAPLRSVVNTHVHFDHLFGNGAFPGVPVLAHDTVPLDLPGYEARIKGLYEAEQGDAHRDAVLSTAVVPPSSTFSSVRSLDLGDRYVELAHLGRGHTRGDIVVRVPDADLLCAGDLVKEAGPPSFGPDCYPMAWGQTLESLSGLIGAGTVVVPGHGRVVHRQFVLAQRLDVVDVAEQIRELAGSGVPVADAVDRGSWPFPREQLADAVRRGYAHLGD